MFATHGSNETGRKSVCMDRGLLKNCPINNKMHEPPKRIIVQSFHKYPRPPNSTSSHIGSQRILNDVIIIRLGLFQFNNTGPRKSNFVFTALHGMQTRSYDEISVRLSVCLSNACIVTKRKKAMFRFLYHTKEHLS